MGVNLSSVEHPGYDRLAPSTVREMHSPFKIPDVEVAKCPECGGIYKGLGCHFRERPEHRPSLTQKQRDLVVGLLMGDGCLHRGREGRNPCLKVNMISPAYLEWLDRAFGPLATGVRLEQTMTESARHNRESGFCPDAEASNYSDKYRWRTRRLPELKEFDWYDESGKTWPDDIELTPTVLKHWFAGDGTWSNHGHNDYIEIALANEVDHADKVDSYFERSDLPTPTYDINERNDRVDCSARFSVEDSHTLWSFMGSPPPGFAYKTPEQYHDSEPAEVVTPVQSDDARTETTEDEGDARGWRKRARDWLGGALR